MWLKVVGAALVGGLLGLMVVLGVLAWRWPGKPTRTDIAADRLPEPPPLVPAPQKPPEFDPTSAEGTLHWLVHISQSCRDIRDNQPARARALSQFNDAVAALAFREIEWSFPVTYVGADGIHLSGFGEPLSYDHAMRRLDANNPAPAPPTFIIRLRSADSKPDFDSAFPASGEDWVLSLRRGHRVKVGGHVERVDYRLQFNDVYVFTVIVNVTSVRPG